MNKYLSFNSHQIHYRLTGSGPTVVLIHGFGEDGEIWNQQVNHLKDSYRLIVPDLPGSGQSELVEDMSIEGMAQVINEILIKESSIASPPGEGLVGAIGHSMGGYIALALAEKYPHVLNALGLFHSTAFADSEEKKSIRKKGIEFIQQHGAREFLKTTTPNLFSQQTKDKRPELIDEQISGLRNFSSLALVSYYNAMMQRPDRTDILKKSNMPVLFIIGEHDNAITLKDSLQQCHLPEKSYIHILTESGHMGMLEEAEKCNRLLKNFLDSTTGFA